MHLRFVEYSKPDKSSGYPFDLPLFKDFKGLKFNTPVTIFVGENGTGKSTLLEGIAAGVGSITIGGSSIEYDDYLGGARKLSRNLRLSWKTKTKKGFFLRAEDFISYIKKIDQEKTRLKEGLRKIDAGYRNRSELARNLAKMPYIKSLEAYKNKYGEGLETKSHGEGFFTGV